MMDYNDGLLPDPCLRMDTHFGDEYESVEFGDGTGYVKAAPMLARLGALHVELDELQAENAKLREERDMYRDLVGMMDHPDLNAQLQAENAKLRSICAEVAGILFNLYVDYCGLCDRDSINHPCPVHTVKGGECLYKTDLRKLGVEVDE